MTDLGERIAGIEGRVCAAEDRLDSVAAANHDYYRVLAEKIDSTTKAVNEIRVKLFEGNGQPSVIGRLHAKIDAGDAENGRKISRLQWLAAVLIGGIGVLGWLLKP